MAARPGVAHGIIWVSILQLSASLFTMYTVIRALQRLNEKRVAPLNLLVATPFTMYALSSVLCILVGIRWPMPREVEGQQILKVCYMQNVLQQMFGNLTRFVVRQLQSTTQHSQFEASLRFYTKHQV